MLNMKKKFFKLDLSSKHIGNFYAYRDCMQLNLYIELQRKIQMNLAFLNFDYLTTTTSHAINK